MKSSRDKKGLSFWNYISILLEKSSFYEFLMPVIIITSFYLAFKIIYSKEDIISNEYLTILIPISFTLFIIVSRLFKFLVNDRERKSESFSTIVQRYENLEKDKNIQSTIKEALNKNPELLNVEKTVYDKILSNLEISLISKLDERFKNNIRTEFIINSIITELSPLTKNIQNYIDRIQRNSIVNLFIGILGTITAITILAFAILTNKAFVDFQTFFIHFLPRFTFVIFIQLFAFFFLRLYKNNLEDAKYFQNELTNLTAKSAAIKISYLMGNTEKVYDILKELASIERNFKLLKDETTIGLEKVKLENDLDKSILDQMKDLLAKYDHKK